MDLITKKKKKKKNIMKLIKLSVEIENHTYHMLLSDTIATRMSYCLLKSEHTVWIGGAHVAKLPATSVYVGP